MEAMLLNISILIVWLYVSFWVFKDAKSRGMNARPWAAFVFLVLFIGLPAYFISRKDKLKESEKGEKRIGKKKSKWLR